MREREEGTRVPGARRVTARPRSIMGLVVRLVEPSVSDDQRRFGTDFLKGWTESGPGRNGGLTWMPGGLGCASTSWHFVFCKGMEEAYRPGLKYWGRGHVACRSELGSLGG